MSDLRAALAYLAEDLHEQGLKAHIDGKPEVSDALMGVSAALRRTLIDAVPAEAPRKKRTLYDRLRIAR